MTAPVARAQVETCGRALARSAYLRAVLLVDVDGWNIWLKPSRGLGPAPAEFRFGSELVVRVEALGFVRLGSMLQLAEQLF